MSFINFKIYPLPSGKFIVSYFDEIKKKRIQKSFIDEILARDFYQNLRSGAVHASQKSEFNTGHLLRAYLKERPDCFLGQSSPLIREFLSAFEIYLPKDITEISMRAFLTQLKNENDYSDRSMLAIKSKLQGFFKYLIETDHIKKSPIENIKFNRGAPFKRKPIILTKIEFQEAIQKAKKMSPALFYPIFKLIYETAAKSSDILKLQWKDLNLKTCELHLNRSTELRPRAFNMSDELLNACRRVQPVSEYIFTNLEGKPLQMHILSRELKRFQRQSQLSTKWGLRDLRSSFAAHYLQGGGSIKSLQKIMGHQTYHNTENIYGRYRVSSTEIKTPAAVPGTEAVS